MRLADAPDLDAVEGASITLSQALLRGDPRLEVLFAPFRDCIAVHETLFLEGRTARASRRLVAEIRADLLDDVRALVREACPKVAFEEKATELDDVAAGTEWRERSGGLSVSAYRLFGGSTALHVTSARLEPEVVVTEALLESPLAIVAELVETASAIEHLSCSRSAGEGPRWHLQAALRDLRRFTEIAPRVLALGFEERGGTYWRERVIVRPSGKDRWMAAAPGIEHGSAKK